MFSSKKAFAIDISDDGIQVLETAGLTKSIASFAHAELPPGIMQDGRIVDQEKLAAAIRETVARAAPRPPKMTCVVAELPESQTYLHHITLEAGVEQKDLADIVMARAEEAIPLDLEASAWDYQILTRTKESLEIMFAAAPAEIVESYEQTLALAGLDLKVLELESLALTRAVLDPTKLAAGTAAVVIDIGGRFTTIAIVDAQGLQLSATMHVAGESFTEAISKKMKSKPEEAEALKREQGFGDATAGDAMRKPLKEIAEEVAAASAYYTRTKNRQVGQAYLAGGSSALPGLDAEMSAMLGIPVALGTPPFSVDGLQPHQIAVVAGLALRARKLSPGINFIVAP